MFNPPINKKIIFLSLFFSVFIIITQIFYGFFDNKTKLVFCDVGQGDAAYIRIRNKIDVLVDAGPDRKVLSCLGKYMPFYDRKIELAIISHPQKDHFGGFLYLSDRYKIEKLLMTPLDNPSQSFKRLKQKIAEKKITVDFPRAGTKINVVNDVLEFYWPTQSFLTANLVYESIQIDQSVYSNNLSQVLGISSLDDNNFSLVFLFQEGDFKALFTGDAMPKVLNEIASFRILGTRNDKHNTTVLKIPHHGSKNGLTEKFLRLAHPAVAVISVGKKNAYGHPAKEILDLLESSKIKIRRTDKEGSIVFKL